MVEERGVTYSGQTQAQYGWTKADATNANEYLLRPVLRLLSRYVPIGGRVVDVGCGNGYVAGMLASAGYVVLGIDASEDGLQLGRRRHPGVQFMQASIYEKDLLTTVGQADAVVALEVVEHLYFPSKLFEFASGVLSAGGTLIASTPYHGYFKNLAIGFVGGWDRHWCPEWEGGHIKFFSKRTLSAMIEEKGFVVDSITGAGRLPGFWKSMLVAASIGPRIPPVGVS